MKAGENMAKGKWAYWLTEDGLTNIRGWARDGLIDEEIAKRMGISKTTFYEWLRRFPSISEALREGKAPVDFYVEQALYKAACSGNITAQIFWLKNRRRKAWKDVWKDDGADDKTITIKLDNSVKDFTN